MATTNSEGTIALWNLNERILIGQKIAAHEGEIKSAFFLLGQPNMITCGSDNKMIRWFMETEISLPIVSKPIEGHNGEVNKLCFLQRLFIVLGYFTQICKRYYCCVCWC